MKVKNFKGIFFILVAATTWGCGGVAGQYLFQTIQADPIWLVSVRQLISGLIFLAYAAVKGQSTFGIIKSDFKPIVAFALIGVLGSQLGFFYTISLCNAATATVLQYTAPIFVMLWVAYKSRKMPEGKELLGIVFALVGVFFISTHGNLDKIVLSPIVLLSGFYSAVTYAYYTLMPVELLKKYSTATVIGWGQFIAGLFLALMENPFNHHYEWTGGAIFAFAYLLIGATIVSFSFYLAGLKLVGPTKASLISCAEPLASITAVVILLGTVLTVEDYIGMGCIIFTVLVLSLPKK